MTSARTPGASDIAPSTLSGGLLLDKPSGITSARAVARVKRLLPKGTRIGHTGTLDPLASGLLILLIGRATRLSRYLTGLDKTYTATARFGASSDTLDADGNITPLPNAPVPTEAAITAATERFRGSIFQIPPMASAVKVGGERLYTAHRRGEEVERQSRPVTISTFALTNLDGDTATFHITCSSGTYVRALVADLADSLNTAAYLTSLRRTAVHHFHTEDSISLDHLDSPTLYKCIIQTREVVGEILPLVTVSEEVGQRFVSHGRPLGKFGFDGSYGVLCGGELLAIYRDEGEASRAEAVLCAG